MPTVPPNGSPPSPEPMRRAPNNGPHLATPAANGGGEQPPELQPGFLTRVRQAAGRALSSAGQAAGRARNYLTAPSSRVVHTALHHVEPPLSDPPHAEGSDEAELDSRSLDENRASSRAPSPTPSDASDADDGASTLAAQKIEAQKLKQMQQLSTINGIEMGFTMTMNGKPVAVNLDILLQLNPILAELAKTPEGRAKLSKGFELVINLDKSSGIHVYQNGNEILTDICASFFENHPDLLKNIQQLQQAIEMAKLLNKPQGAVKNPDPSKMTLRLEAAPAPSDCIIQVNDNGDCLLDAALVLIKNKDPGLENLTARKIREEISAKLKQDLQDKNINNLKRMLNDIFDARKFAQEDGKNLTQEAPFSYLLNGDIDNICSGNPEEISEENYKTLVTAYINYITDQTNPIPASLGDYATNYLSEKYFNSIPFLIVRGNKETSFKSIKNFEYPDCDLDNIPVLLYNGSNHYDAIDSSSTVFWKKFQK